ncbi:2,4-dienoyl CoA reductase 2, peroxisomal, isoform CRA_e [Homo sapiens]|nr:2,4-dienoyl CoA reductase 2, peroxisomal, isoform CRA_e [Homo sapiens]
MAQPPPDVEGDDCLPAYRHLFCPDLLRDKVAFITGGGSGIGFRIAEIFMRHGCHTVIASRSLPRVLTAVLPQSGVQQQTQGPRGTRKHRPLQIPKAFSPGRGCRAAVCLFTWLLGRQEAGWGHRPALPPSLYGRPSAPSCHGRRGPGSEGVWQNRHSH